MREEQISLIREYNKTLQARKLSELERWFTEAAIRPYFYSFQNSDLYGYFRQDVESFLQEQKQFRHLLKEQAEAACCFLHHVTQYTYTSGLIRITARSPRLYEHRIHLLDAIGSFYLFHALRLDMTKLIQGYYQRSSVISYAPVMATAFLMNERQAIETAKEVLLSEHNTGILTRDLIIAIEMSEQEELQDLLLQVFLAARLQEGLRQSVAETCDAYQYSFFMKSVHLIVKENLIRYSSIQRAVMTWCGLGYEEAGDKQVKELLGRLVTLMDQEEAVQKALTSSQPLDVYLALFVLGMQNVEQAEAEALRLLSNTQPQVIASVIVYLKMIQRFQSADHLTLFDQYEDHSWIIALLYSSLSFENKDCFADAEEAIHFMRRLERYVREMKKEEKFSSKGFTWFSITLQKEPIITAMYQLCTLFPSQATYDLFLPYAASILTGDPLRTFLQEANRYCSRESQMSFLLKQICSPREQLQEIVKDQLLSIELEEQDILQLEERLKTKKGSARGRIVEVLAHQKPNVIKASYQRLLVDSLQYRKDAAKELRQKVPKVINDEEPIAQSRTYTMEEGLGLVDPKEEYSFSIEQFLMKRRVKKGLFKTKEVIDFSTLYVWNGDQVNEYLMKWANRIKDHGEEEYVSYDGYVLLKDRFWMIDHKAKGLDAYPFAQVWRDYFEEDQLSSEQLFTIRLCCLHRRDRAYLSDFMNDTKLPYDNVHCQKEIPLFDQIEYLLTAYAQEREDIERPIIMRKAEQLLAGYMACCTSTFYIEKTYHGHELSTSISSLSSISFLLSYLESAWRSEEEFNDVFALLSTWYDRFSRKTQDEMQNKYTLDALFACHAVNRGLAKRSLIAEVILTPFEKPQKYAYHVTHALSIAIDTAYFNGNRYRQRKPKRTGVSSDSRYHKDVSLLYDVLDEITDRMLDKECARINEASDVTDYIRILSVVFGADRLIKIVKAMGKESFSRSSYGNEKRDLLTYLVRNSYPLDEHDADKLKDSGISAQRLVEIAMLAPQWIDVIASVLDWDGFKEGCYYFIAHMKESGDEEKKAEIARYTNLDPLDLRDGAFDMEWCREVYGRLGEERFKLLYQAAKFLCDNSFHTRARKYADACLGFVKKEELRGIVEEKRNKDALNAYAIAPLQDDRDLLERYTYIRQFMKDSRQFKAQRRASEKRSAEIALMNLARNSRYESVTRLSWIMEAAMVQQQEHYLHPQHIDDYEVWIEIDSQGKNQLMISKDHKKLKSIPAKLKNIEQFQELQSTHKQWMDQYRRSKELLESAMEEQTKFSREELTVIMKNPIVAPLLSSLVLKQGTQFGFYKDGLLAGGTETYELQEEVQIAHPYQLYQAGVWRSFQKHIFTNKIIQPFKQVFRELYLKLEDELNQTQTSRYSGYQIQIKKAAGALKSRNWNLSYEEGMQRVYYKEDLMVSLYAEADWFSPSDIEAPSIDYVSFCRRTTYQPVRISDIDPVIFSEIMRDLDMAVSVAYVGGVDPITSFSTMELRSSIIEYTMKLMKITNVEVNDHFAKIRGTLNEYTVHLGSGVVHQHDGGSLHILPVHSSKRGKLYLPFLDEDPKTAEILSKVILLAEDHKLKDPTILSQIHRREE